MTHYIRTATVLVLTLLLQCAAEGFPDFRPPPTDLHWRDAEAIAAYAHKPIDEIGKPPERPVRASRKAELLKPEDCKLLVKHSIFYRDNDPAVAPRLQARIVSVRPYHFHWIDEVGASVLVDMQAAGPAWPSEFFVGIQSPEGWEVDEVLSCSWFSRHENDITRWGMGVESNDFRRRFVGVGRYSRIKSDWIATDTDGYLLVLMRRTK